MEERCSSCGGTGKVSDDDDGFDIMDVLCFCTLIFAPLIGMPREEECPDCKGRGWN